MTTLSPPSPCGRCMYNRAVLLERDGHLTDAEDMQRRCLQLRQHVLGLDHHQVMNKLLDAAPPST
jgi:hypothetical protein